MPTKPATASTEVDLPTRLEMAERECEELRDEVNRLRDEIARLDSDLSDEERRSRELEDRLSDVGMRIVHDVLRGLAELREYGITLPPEVDVPLHTAPSAHTMKLTEAARRFGHEV